MKDTTAFAIIKELKALGHAVKAAEAPVFGDRRPYKDGGEDLAVSGDASMKPEAVESCLAVIRDRVGFDSLTIEKTGNAKRRFPDTAFAAW